MCDVVEPWAHGTVLRATRYPGFFDLSLVRVEDDPALSVEALIAFCDEALAGLVHRRLDFDLVDAGETLRAGLAVARKLLKRSYHTLRELGEEALKPA